MNFRVGSHISIEVLRIQVEKERRKNDACLWPERLGGSVSRDRKVHSLQLRAEGSSGAVIHGEAQEMSPHTFQVCRGSVSGISRRAQIWPIRIGGMSTNMVLGSMEVGEVQVREGMEERHPD